MSGMSIMTEFSTNRARRIVRRASCAAENPFLENWLFHDEKGTWEELAAEYLADEAFQAKLARIANTEDDADRLIACHLLIIGLDIMIEKEGERRRGE